MFVSECIETIPYEEIEEVDETKDPGFWEQTQEPHTGYVYWSYKNYYDENGKFMWSEKCAISEYTKYDAKYIVGPEPDPDIPTDILQGVIDGTIDLNDWLSGKYDEIEEEPEE